MSLYLSSYLMDSLDGYRILSSIPFSFSKLKAWLLCILAPNVMRNVTQHNLHFLSLESFQDSSSLSLMH